MKETTFERYKSFVRVHIAPALGHVALSRLTRQDVQRFLHSLPGKISPTTAHHVGAMFRQSLDYAVRMGLVAQNPSDEVDIPRRARPLLEVWTVEHAQAFLTEARRSSKYPLLYALAICTGMRLGELLNLQWNDLDLNKGLLHVGQGKTANARRTILLPVPLVGELRARRGIGLVFCAKNGKRLNPSNVRCRDFHPTCDRAGVPRARIHDLRHFHASHMVANGIDLASLSHRMGHSSRSFTLQTYGHLLPGGEERIVEAATLLLLPDGASAVGSPVMSDG